MPITTSTSTLNDGPRQRNLPNGVAKPDRHTNGTATTYMNGSTTAEPSNIKTRKAANGNGRPVTAAAPVVDWEIPRKTLHSSIGSSTLRHVHFSLLTRYRRLLGALAMEGWLS
jgi:hypothetical protein